MKVRRNKVMPQLVIFGTLGAQSVATYFAYHSEFLPNLLSSIVPAEYEAMARTFGTIAQVYAAWVGVGSVIAGTTKTAKGANEQWKNLPKNVAYAGYYSSGMYEFAQGKILGDLALLPFGSAVQSACFIDERNIANVEFYSRAKSFAISLIGAGVLAAQCGAVYAALKHLPVEDFVAGIFTSEYKDAAQLIAKIGVGVAAWIGSGIASHAVLSIHRNARVFEKWDYLGNMTQVAEILTGAQDLKQGEIAGAILNVVVGPSFRMANEINTRLNSESQSM